MSKTAPRPRWYAIVLSWNRQTDTLACIESLTNLDPPVEVTCVDNGSIDGSAEAVRTRFPQVAVIENGANLGYAGGNNVGIAHALASGADWVVLVNNDAIVASGAIGAFQGVAAAHPRAGMLAGKVFFAQRPHRVWFAGGRTPLWLGYFGRTRGYDRIDRPRYRRPGPTCRATGAFMAISRAAIESVGTLEESYFAYVEDVDWSVRVRRAGFELLFVPDAVAFHAVSASTGGERASTHNLYYGARNTIALVERLAPLGRWLTLLRRLVVLSTFTAQAVGRPDRVAAMGAVLDGVRDACRGKSGIR